MKKIIFSATLILICSVQFAFAQDEVKKFEPNGKVQGTVFFNYHYDLTENAQKKSQFELLRSYFGYSYNFSEQFSTRIVFDVGYDSRIDANQKTKNSYSAFLKIASLQWKYKDLFTAEGGMIPTNMYDTQEKFLGYRYLLEPLQDRYFPSADLGVRASYKPVKMIELRTALYNGEGYKSIQDNYGLQKFTADIIIRPIEGLTFKTYYDIMSKKDTLGGQVIKLENKQLLNFFLGYEKKDMFRVGAEYVIQQNSDFTKDKTANGITAYAIYIIKKFELFARYDQTRSNTLEGKTEDWNLSNDFDMILGGVQYTPVTGVRMSMNYRHYIPIKSTTPNTSFIYLNFEYKF